MKKLITISVPVFNEEKNIDIAYRRITNVMSMQEKYDYEIVFFDDGSTDNSRKRIEEICSEDEHVKAVLYTRNFGYNKTVFYAMQQAKGDCAIIVHCDMQNPPEEIPRLIEKWEQGADVVLGVKNRSKENRLMYFLRTLGYFIMNFVFGLKLVPHATEFELFDCRFISVLKGIKVNMPFLRGYIYEYARKIEKIYYTQDKRRSGKSHFNLQKYYDFTIDGIVSFSRGLPRKIILLIFLLIIGLIAETVVFAVKNAGVITSTEMWNSIILRVILFALLCTGVFLCLALEYIIGLINRSDEKPFVIEEKRINY